MSRMMGTYQNDQDVEVQNTFHRLVLRMKSGIFFHVSENDLRAQRAGA